MRGFRSRGELKSVRVIEGCEGYLTVHERSKELGRVKDWFEEVVETDEG
jgi:hypothetical protein